MLCLRIQMYYVMLAAIFLSCPLKKMIEKKELIISKNNKMKQHTTHYSWCPSEL